MLGNPTILYGSEIWGGSIYKETWKKIKQIHMHFIINNIKIKISTPYTNLLSRISCMESKTMIRYLVYTHEITNMNNKRLPNNASKALKITKNIKEGGIKMHILGYTNKA